MKRPVETQIPTQREALRYFVRLILLIRPYWRRLLQGLGLGLVIAAIGMVTPYLSKTFFDEVYPSRSVSLMHVLVIGTVVVGFSSALMGALRGYYSQVVTGRLTRTVSLMFFNHLQHLPVSFFDSHRVGEVMSRAGDIRNGLAQVSSVMQTVLVSGTYLLIVPPVLLTLNWKLAMLSMIALPMTTAISLASGQVIRRYTKRGAEVAAEFSAYQMEVLSHIRTVKSMAAEHHVYSRAGDQLEEGLRLQLKSGAFSTIVGIFSTLVQLTGMAIFTWYSWTLILRGELTLGGFIAFSAYLGYLTGPVGQFAGLFVGFQQTAVTLGRAFEYLDTEPEQDPAEAYQPSPAPHRQVRGLLEFSRVSFGYDVDRRVLHDVSLTIPAGSTTSIVGPSGAGKSSMLRLICRMSEPDTGQLALDGVPLRAYALPELRRQVGVVWQEFSLMRGTVWDNITFGIPDADPADVREAVRICRLEALISDLPEGLDTPVAEWGASLSGGQRQRLAIARALVRNTPVLLLDEATSQIDVETEEELLRDLFASIRGRTIVVVTHRIATAALADQICLLNAGRVESIGAHKQLVAESESYRRMLRAAGVTEEPRQLRVVGSA
jgi:ABC-type bacteriocin/lantibiotic exporter with double-glycine peptidase domain